MRVPTVDEGDPRFPSKRDLIEKGYLGLPPFRQLPVLGFRQFKPAQHLEMRFGRRRNCFLIGGFRCRFRHKHFRREGLKLDGICPGVRRGIDQIIRDIQVAIMVDPRLGNDKAGGVSTNLAVANVNEWGCRVRQRTETRISRRFDCASRTNEAA